MREGLAGRISRFHLRGLRGFSDSSKSVCARKSMPFRFPSTTRKKHPASAKGRWDSDGQPLMVTPL